MPPGTGGEDGGEDAEDYEDGKLSHAGPPVLFKGGRYKESIERWAFFCQAAFYNILPFFVESIDSPFETPIPHHAMYDEAVRLIESGWFEAWRYWQNSPREAT